MSIIETTDREIDVRALQREALNANTALTYARTYRRLDYAKPSPIQQQVLDNDKFACFFMGANQVGKSYVMALLAANIGLQRDKEPGWKGWKQPVNKLERQYSVIIWWVSPTNAVSMAGGQPRCLGAASGPAFGTGTFPLETIESVSIQHGVSGCIESFTFRRPDGTLGLMRFKSVAAGVEVLQGESVDLIIIDELPKTSDAERLLAELISRVSATGGCIRMSATALRQASPIVAWFKEPGHDHEREIIHASRDMATHISAEDNARFLASLPTKEDIDTRYLGLEWGGQGQIYSIPFSEIEDQQYPEEFPTNCEFLIAVDLPHMGLSPNAVFAACFFARDPFTGVVHLFDAIEMRGALPEAHAAKIKASAVGDAPVAWPHDGNAGTSTGETYAQVYRRLGLRMLPKHATHEGVDNYALEPGIDAVVRMMATGKLKIARHLLRGDFGRALKLYERDDDGKPIKFKGDHLLDAMRVGCMSLRFARPLSGSKAYPNDYDDDRYDNGTSTSFGSRRPRSKSWDPFTGLPD